jgi:transposase
VQTAWLGECGAPATAGLGERWMVERTLAWLNRCRRLSKSWKNLNHKTRAFLLMASIRLMVRRLCRA